MENDEGFSGNFVVDFASQFGRRDRVGRVARSSACLASGIVVAVVAVGFSADAPGAVVVLALVFAAALVGGGGWLFARSDRRR